jgi:hypothetical protein
MITLVVMDVHMCAVTAFVCLLPSDRTRNHILAMDAHTCVPSPPRLHARHRHY